MKITRQNKSSSSPIYTFDEILHKKGKIFATVGNEHTKCRFIPILLGVIFISSNDILVNCSRETCKDYRFVEVDETITIEFN